MSESKPAIELTHEEKGGSWFFAGIDLAFFTGRKFEEGDHVVFGGKPFIVTTYESVEGKPSSWRNTYDLPYHVVAIPSK